jgi:putative PIN family toxin of toxin-antitoxin system
MQKIVIDTNVLVSALWSDKGRPAQLLALVINDKLTPCYDYRIMREYREVLARPKFIFNKANVSDILNKIKSDGISVVSTPLDIDFKDPTDKMFYEVAKFCCATLITGNIKHFPKEGNVVSVKDFLDGIA